MSSGDCIRGDIQVATRSFPEVSLESVLKKTKIDAASAEIRVYPTIKSYDATVDWESILSAHAILLYLVEVYLFISFHNLSFLRT